MLFADYLFGLTAISLICFSLERFFPWRRQDAFRDQLGQDLFWLVFNGHIFSFLIAWPSLWLISAMNAFFHRFGAAPPVSWNVLDETPLWIQFLVFLFLQDFLEWCIHNLLHRAPLLWKFHRIHHSIQTMDWIGNMRFHWMELVVYKSLKYFPLVILGVDWRVILGVAVLSTAIGHLNHSNLNWGYGPLGHAISSPRFHIWHHDVVNHQKNGQNFAIIFTLWDHLFGTAYRSETDQPAEIGFKGLHAFPQKLLPRLLYPLGCVFSR